MPEKKNKFDNPIEQFLTEIPDSTEKEKLNNITGNEKRKQIPIQDRPKIDRNGRELKRKRYNLLLLPSLYEDVKKIAYVEKIKVNEAINRALKFYLEKEKKTLEKYAEIEKLKTSE